MRDALSPGERLSPDTVTRLERAAVQRFDSAEVLGTSDRRLAALYFYGYSAEICLAAAYYRSAGFRPDQSIDRDTRQRRMTQARQLGLMSSDAHPLIGWARFLEWQRNAGDSLTDSTAQRLREAVNKASEIYKYWRPELRYKVADIPKDQLNVVRRAACWIKDNQTRF